MSEVTRERAEEIVADWGKPGARNLTTVQLLLLAVREEREWLMEPLCGVCGEIASDGDCCNYRQQAAGNPVARAEYLRRKGGE